MANGRRYWDQLQKGGSETSWLDLDDLTGVDLEASSSSNGWSYEEIGGGAVVIQDLQRAYKDLNIPTDRDSNREIELHQDREFYRCGSIRPATSADNEGIYNVAGKAIASTYNHSPNFQLRKKLKVDRLSDEQAQGLPQVTRWSDIVWIVWNSLTQGPSEASALKYIFRYDVSTDDTVFIMEQVLGLGRDDLPDGEEGAWPGYKFVPGHDEFWALLGTVHGRSVAYLLLDRPNELRWKLIESITLFRADDGGDTWQLLFTLTGPGNDQ